MGCGQFLIENSKVLAPKAKQKKPSNQDTAASIEKKESVKKEKKTQKKSKPSIHKTIQIQA